MINPSDLLTDEVETMARPLGSKNKTTAELKVEGELIKQKARLKELQEQKKALEAARRKNIGNKKNGQ